MTGADERGGRRLPPSQVRPGAGLAGAPEAQDLGRCQGRLLGASRLRFEVPRSLCRPGVSPGVGEDAGAQCERSPDPPGPSLDEGGLPDAPSKEHDGCAASQTPAGAPVIPSGFAGTSLGQVISRLWAHVTHLLGAGGRSWPVASHGAPVGCQGASLRGSASSAHQSPVGANLLHLRQEQTRVL